MEDYPLGLKEIDENLKQFATVYGDRYMPRRALGPSRMSFHLVASIWAPVCVVTTTTLFLLLLLPSLKGMLQKWDCLGENIGPGETLRRLLGYPGTQHGRVALRARNVPDLTLFSWQPMPSMVTPYHVLLAPGQALPKLWVSLSSSQHACFQGGFLESQERCNAQPDFEPHLSTWGWSCQRC